MSGPHESASDLDVLRSRLTAAGLRWAQARRDHTTRTAEAREQLAAVRADHQALVAELAALAAEGAAAGLSESEMARRLGVSRAKTLRKWLGK